MWTLNKASAHLLDKVKLNEGSIPYQTKLGYFRGGRFHVYKDSLGFPTIGYGHLLKPNESFPNGITPAEADALLANDLVTAINGAKEIHDQYKMLIPESIQETLVEMVFQMGKSKVLKFKGVLTALSKNDYTKAIVEMKDSNWYRQTPNRVKGHIKVLMENGGK